MSNDIDDWQDMEILENNIANAFYNEDYIKIHQLTGIMVQSQAEFEERYIK